MIFGMVLRVLIFHYKGVSYAEYLYYIVVYISCVEAVTIRFNHKAICFKFFGDQGCDINRFYRYLCAGVAHAEGVANKMVGNSIGAGGEAGDEVGGFGFALVWGYACASGLVVHVADNYIAADADGNKGLRRERLPYEYQYYNCEDPFHGYLFAGLL